ncbi:uncharacterized protein LTR77_008364 [Saxophila tyrrhenica]|uniref:Uncharacterized protein n=1 Tax=Saxophila tyrrhenica TaxID=1690608 RepID=A0AAV9P1B5_9PEZI|nr:hypothetical protein LTR77_008364 [Saxophila tyrrhenica]
MDQHVETSRERCDRLTKKKLALTQLTTKLTTETSKTSEEARLDADGDADQADDNCLRQLTQLMAEHDSPPGSLMLPAEAIAPWNRVAAALERWIVKPVRGSADETALHLVLLRDHGPAKPSPSVVVG